MVVKWRVAHWRNAVHAARTWTHGRRLGEGGLWVDCGLALCPFEMRRRSALAGTAGTQACQRHTRDRPAGEDAGGVPGRCRSRTQGTMRRAGPRWRVWDKLLLLALWWVSGQ